MHKNSLIISLTFLITGFVSAYFIFGSPADDHSSPGSRITAPDNNASLNNPFSTITENNRDDERLSYLEDEISLLKQELKKLNSQLKTLTKATDKGAFISHPEENIKKLFSSVLNQRLYNLDNLIKGGIDASLAEDIVRRKSSIELKRLALQDRATRDNYLNTQRYFDELTEINKQDVSLRDELGEDRYDEYLFNSKQNNRIRISSVMLGSAAEQTGIQKGDIVLSYDNTRMFNWQELKDATSEGSLGEYVSISIYRNGEIYSFSVPRGPLGIQLGATRLAP